MFATSTRNSFPASSATAANASSGGAPAATSVATRRNAACSSASRASLARLSVFAIAVATSSVKEIRRASVSAGQLLTAERDDDAAPHPALGADRHANRRAQPPITRGDLADHAGDVAVVDPGRPAGAVHQRGHVAPAEWQLAADRGRWRGARSGPGADDLEGVLRVVADQDREVDRQQPADLPGDRGEHLLRWSRPGHQRRHPPQRGLLLGQLTEPRLIGWVTAHPRVRGTGA